MLMVKKAFNEIHESFCIEYFNIFCDLLLKKKNRKKYKFKCIEKYF